MSGWRGDKSVWVQRGEQVAAQSDYVVSETAWLEIMGNMVQDLLHLSS